MIYYILPEPGIYGGIKVGFQFSSQLRNLGCPVVVATPGGRSPSWFNHEVPTANREQVINSLTKSDVVLFSLPHDYLPLSKTPAKLVLHCQGTDPLIDPIVADPEVLKLSCWTQAKEYMEEKGSESIEVGISISDSFFYRGQRKLAQRVSYMPRKIKKSRTFHGFNRNWQVIDGLSENETAKVMNKSDGFIAVVEDEWFGLPALEAMAASCLVVSPRAIGGMEYLRDSENCSIVPVKDLANEMSRLLELPDIAKSEMRLKAFETALAYHPSAQSKLLKEVLKYSDFGRLICA